MRSRLDARQGWKVAVRGLLLTVVMILATMVTFNLWARHRLESEVEAVELAGDSLDMESFLTTLEEGEANASDILDAIGYLQAASPRGVEPPFDRSRVHLDRPADPDLLRQVTEWLDRPEQSLLLQLVDLGSGIDQARYPRGPADLPGLQARWEEYGRLRPTSIAVAWLLYQRAFVHLASGDSSAAFDDVTKILRLAHWIRTELPNMVSALVGGEVTRQGLVALEELLQTATMEDEVAERLSAELQRLRSAGVVRALEAERAFSYRLAQSAQSAQSADLAFLGAVPFGSAIAPGFFNAVTAETLRALGQLIRFADQPPYERPPFDTLLDDKVRSPFRTVGQMLIPSLRNGVEKMDETDAQVRLSLIAMAFEAYRADRSDSPHSVRQLVPGYLDEVPVDPFSGSPLLERRADDRCILYSVGRNRTDDGGTGGRGPTGSPDGDDLAWRLPCS